MGKDPAEGPLDRPGPTVRIKRITVHTNSSSVFCMRLLRVRMLCMMNLPHPRKDCVETEVVLEGTETS
jgi:hypothetical protein